MAQSREEQKPRHQAFLAAHQRYRELRWVKLHPAPTPTWALADLFSVPRLPALHREPSGWAYLSA